jgi:ATP-dependent helicase/nuclease subunit A
MHEPTSSQLAAITDADRHALVHAGAGTGKTATVVFKILYELGVELGGRRHPNPIELHQIAAITYTLQAAADLKRKLRTALFECGRSEDAYEVDAARIGTIHAFTHDLLREFSLRVGRPFPAKVVDENESAALTADAIRDAVLADIESESLEGLDELLTTWSVKEVEGFVAQLVNESDRLSKIAERRAELEPVAGALVDLALHALRLIESRLEARAGVDFDRMVAWTRDMLAKRDDVRRAIQRRIKLLIVDEFQDVDPPQKDLAYLLGQPASASSDTTRLMLVGDPKQSIYRFRRADVTVWYDVQRDFEEKQFGRVILLGESFRSLPPILGFADSTVGKILQTPIEGERHRPYEVAYHPVSAMRTTGPNERPVEIHLVPPTEEGKGLTGNALRLLEAETIARRARELHDNGLEWRDMALIMRSWAPLDVYRSALRRVSAPSYALQTAGFFDRREIMDLLLALEVIRDPNDDRALLGFLRSPFVGVKDETLLWIARRGERPYWTHLERIKTGENDLVQRGVALLTHYAALRDRIPTAELLDRLLRETGYLAHLALLGDEGMQRIANIRKFMRTVRGMPAASVGEVVRTFRESKGLGIREGDAPLYGETDNVITLTTIHSAKGLEWRVVFWCDLTRRGGSWGQEKFLLGRDGFLLGDPERKTKEQTREYRDLHKQLSDEDAAETKRLWYVAATRAMDLLILPAVPQGRLRSKDSPAAAIKNCLPSLDEPGLTKLTFEAADGSTHEAAVHYASEGPPGAAVPLEAAEEPADLSVPAQQIVVPVSRPRHSATEYLAHTRCPKKHWFKYVKGVREPDIDRSGEDFINAIVRGQIVHDVLEHLQEQDELDQLLEDAIGRWDANAPPPEGREGHRYRSHLREEVESVASHPEYRALADHPSAQRELKFLYIHNEHNVAEGRIDLAAAPDEGVVLLDVKTSQVDAQTARERVASYESQRNVYITASEGISTHPISRFAFQFTRAGVQISDEISDDVRANAQINFLETAAAIGRGEPELTQYPRECEFCGYKRVGWCEGVRREK